MNVSGPRSALLPTAIALLVLALGCGSESADNHEPAVSTNAYAGLEKRAIKALSPKRVADLLAARGAGYALAAELNHHPGPMHVLELRDRLGLGGEQERAVRAIRQSMHARGRRLGRRVVELEGQLDAAFRSGKLGEQQLAELTAEIGRVESRLRRVHLAAHIRTREVLSRQQIARYDRLRGYADGPRAAHSGDGAQHQQHER